MTAVRISGASNVVPLDSSTVERALELLMEALAILDQSIVAPEIGARLAEVIAATEEQQEQR